MKKLKAFQWVFLGMIGTGLLLGFISMCMFGWDFDNVKAAVTQAKFYGDAPITKTIDPADKTQVSLDLGNQSVAVTKTTDSEFTLTWWEHSRYTKTTFSDGETDGKIYLKLREKFSFRMNLWTASKYSKVTIAVPETFVGEIKIIAHNGDINVKDLDVSVIDIKNSNGRSEVKNCTADNIVIVNSNGDIKLDGVTAPEVSLKNFNGRSEIADTEADTITANNSNGNIIIKGTTAKDVTVNNSNGTNDITLHGDADDYYIEFKNYNGSSWLNGSKCSGIVRTGTHGTIKITTHNGTNKLKFTA